MELRIFFFKKNPTKQLIRVGVNDHRKNEKLLEKHWEGSISWYWGVIDMEREEEAVILGIQHNIIVSWIYGGKIQW